MRGRRYRYNRAGGRRAWSRLGALLFLGLGAGLAASCAIAQPGDDSLPGVLGPPCVSGSDCEAGLVCKAGRCAPCSCPKNDTCDPDTGACSSGPGICEATCLKGTFCSVSGDCIEEGTCIDDGDCAGEGLVCDPAENVCIPGSGCVDGEIPTKRLGPNLMILFDRTGSMANTLDGSMETRLDAARKAVIAVLEAHEGDVRFGISLFSACKTGGCAPGIVNDPLGSETITMKLTLEGTTACQSGENETSLGATLQKFVNYAPLQAEGRDNAILVIADGGENCMGDPAAVAQAIAGQPISVPVHTIGFTAAANEAELMAISGASAAGTFASALTGAELQGAVENVVELLQSCAFDLAYSPSGGDIHVFFNDEPEEIPESDIDGWTINPAGTAVIFHGMACDFITEGLVADVDVVEGCAAPTPD
ncbi:MAG: VWA domain-containing protein [Polyangiaceae bacterium]|nr:VWA domain-containing protein [Polyangiaceae bacterium]